MTPDNFTTNFKDRKIYIEFDEFVQIKDQQKEFFTSPQMKKKPTITLRGRGISVQLRDTLRENTTYALNFGSAICDNNEGNPLYSMRYVFPRTRDRLRWCCRAIRSTLQGRQREQELHLLLHRRLGSRTQRVRFDAVQLQAAGHRPRRDQRYFPGAEPQTGSLPRLRLPGYQRQPDVRNRRSTRWVFWTV